MTEETINQRIFSINTNVRCEDSNKYVLMIEKTQAFVNEIVTLLGNEAGNLLITIDARNSDS